MITSPSLVCATSSSTRSSGFLSATEDTGLFDGAFVASENEGSMHLYFLSVESHIDLCRSSSTSKEPTGVCASSASKSMAADEE